VGNSAHATLQYITDEQYERIENNPDISRVGYQLILTDDIRTLELESENLLLTYMDEDCIDLNYSLPTVGSIPSTERDILLDTGILDKLGIPHRIGEEIELDFQIRNTKITETFVLSGFYEKKTVTDISYLMVSKKFVTENKGAIEYSYASDYNISGTVAAYIELKDAKDIEASINKILIATNLEGVDYALNWAYVSSGNDMDFEVVVAIASACLLFFLTGYLIIYNIFQISLNSEIRFIGLLKTIGCSPRQVKNTYYLQAIVLSVISIPLGLTLGYILGTVLFPEFSKILTITELRISSSPIIFVVSALFTLCTIFLSIRKPCSAAAKLDPVQSTNYYDDDYIKSVRDAGKLHKMAYANLLRNKKRSIIVIVSMALSIVIFNSVFLVSNCFDLDKYIRKYVDSDFLIANSSYFKSEFFNESDSLDLKTIQLIENQKGYTEGGSLYFNVNFESCMLLSPPQLGESENSFSQEMNGLFELYGLDEYPLKRLEVYQGAIDIEKLESGKYIIYGLNTDDNGNAILDETYNVGDSVNVAIDGKQRTYEVMALIKKNYANNTVRYRAMPYTFYLPSSEFSRVIDNPVRMSFVFDVSDSYGQSFEEFLKSYTSGNESRIDYSSKQSYAAEFEGVRSMVLLIGGMLSLICGVIGLLNFINSMVSGLLDRKVELLLMRKIGMTIRQQSIMLIFEGLYYSLSTVALAFIVSILFSEIALRSVINSTWFGTYSLTVVPIVCIAPLLILATVIIPVISSRTITK
jgi:putative ABC transport system permease protein